MVPPPEESRPEERDGSPPAEPEWEWGRRDLYAFSQPDQSIPGWSPHPLTTQTSLATQHKKQTNSIPLAIGSSLVPEQQAATKRGLSSGGPCQKGDPERGQSGILVMQSLRGFGAQCQSGEAAMLRRPAFGSPPHITVLPKLGMIGMLQSPAPEWAPCITVLPQMAGEQASATNAQPSLHTTSQCLSADWVQPIRSLSRPFLSAGRRRPAAQPAAQMVCIKQSPAALHIDRQCTAELQGLDSFHKSNPQRGATSHGHRPGGLVAPKRRGRAPGSQPHAALPTARLVASAAARPVMTGAAALVGI